MITVQLRTVASVLGGILKWVSLPLAAPLALAILDGTDPVPWLLAVAIALGVGLALERIERDDLYDREAFLIVALAWLSIALLGAIPLYLEGTGVFSQPINALFEAMSGITTTGATVIIDFDAHSRPLLLWRQIIQWLGGLGILLLATAVLSRLSVAGAQLMESETATEELTKLTPSIAGTAKILVGLYAVLTAGATLILVVLGASGMAPEMTLFDAVSHAMTSIGTAGFSPRAESVGAFAPVVHWAIILFMIVGATNFVLIYALIRGNTQRLRDSEEFHFYLGILGVGTLLVFLLLVSDGTYTNGTLTTIRESLFQVVSIVTTTGFASTDFNLWSPAAKNVLFIGMFLGGMVGSTTCSIKTLRWLLVVKGFRRDLAVSAHPDRILPVRLSGTVVEESTIRDVYAYTLIAILIFLVSTVLIVANEARGAGVGEFEAMSAAASTFLNIGPAFGDAGPYGSYEGFTRSTKLLMTVLMWVGRIEIIPVLVLLTPKFWTR